ncbi:hypothetical protein Fmac_021960 [Flemingia macrophylla]|uniref:Uncharacterized protein n=1 Tax=Flemingia macrophylla TaxID=520843 RepID=A0ABD1LYZ4_9FABA
MSIGSIEQQIPPQVEEESSSVSKKEVEGANIIRVDIAQEGIEELEECKTPTCSSNKIPMIQKCPSASRKRRRPMQPFSLCMKRSSSTGLTYVVWNEEVESLFRSMFHEFTRVKNRGRSI